MADRPTRDDVLQRDRPLEWRSTDRQFGRPDPSGQQIPTVRRRIGRRCGVRMIRVENRRIGRPVEPEPYRDSNLSPSEENQ